MRRRPGACWGEWGMGPMHQWLASSGWAVERLDSPLPADGLSVNSDLPTPPLSAVDAQGEVG